MKKYLIIGLIILLIGIGISIYFITKDNTVSTSLVKLQVNEVTRSVFYAPQYVAIAKGFMKEESFELLQTVMEEAGELKQKVPFDKVINNSYAEESKK